MKTKIKIFESHIEQAVTAVEQDDLDYDDIKPNRTRTLSWLKKAYKTFKRGFIDKPRKRKLLTLSVSKRYTRAFYVLARLVSDALGGYVHPREANRLRACAMYTWHRLLKDYAEEV